MHVTLNKSDCGLGDDGMKALCDALMENTALTKLDLGGLNSKFCNVFFIYVTNRQWNWRTRIVSIGWFTEKKPITHITEHELWRFSNEILCQKDRNTIFFFISWFTANAVRDDGKALYRELLNMNTALTELHMRSLLHQHFFQWNIESFLAIQTMGLETLR